MGEYFSLTGGARIGKGNATFPFANLWVDKKVLKINASIVGNLIFQRKDIISIEPYKGGTLFGKGIVIHHRVANYDPTVIFWTRKEADYVISEIEKTGFFDNLNDSAVFTDIEVIKRQKQGGFPLKKPTVIIFIVLWNLLFLSDFLPFFLQDFIPTLHQNNRAVTPFGNGVKAAIGLLLIAALLTLVSKGFRRLILKEGRDFSEISKFVYFIIMFCIIWLLGTSVINFDQGRKTTQIDTGHSTWVMR